MQFYGEIFVRKPHPFNVQGTALEGEVAANVGMIYIDQPM